MNKEEIFDKLSNCSLNLDECIIIGGASLVVQGLLDETSDIDFACSSKYYDSIDWDYDSSVDNGKVLKVNDCYSISSTFYDEDSYIEIDGYKYMTIEKIYEIKKNLNRKKDKKIIKDLDLYLCLKDNYRYERELKEKGISIIAGVDEVGRGPLVGPVVAACVVLPDNYNLDGLTDSKKLSEKKRDFYFDEINKIALGVGIGIIDEKKIDEVNIYAATKLAMKDAINEELSVNRIASHAADRANAISDATTELAQKLGREATLEELCEYMSLSEDEVRDVMKMSIDAMTITTNAQDNE